MLVDALPVQVYPERKQGGVHVVRKDLFGILKPLPQHTGVVNLIVQILEAVDKFLEGHVLEDVGKVVRRVILPIRREIRPEKPAVVV